MILPHSIIFVWVTKKKNETSDYKALRIFFVSQCSEFKTRIFKIQIEFTL